MEPHPADATGDRLEASLEQAVLRLERARPFAKIAHLKPVLDIAQRIMRQPDGIARLYRYAPRADAAGLFSGTSWDDPATLLPGMVKETLDNGRPETIVLECLSELRLLAIANSAWARPGMPAQHARHFLSQILALNLSRLFGAADEAQRVRSGPLDSAVDRHLQYLLTHVGFEDILGELIDEIWRILAQRPIQIDHVKAMVTQIAATLVRGVGDLGETRLAADRLINALFGPTHGSFGDPGLDAYCAHLQAMDTQNLQHEAYGFSRAMHDTGLVSDYHAAFLRWLLENGQASLIADALGLSSSGKEVLRLHEELAHSLIAEAVHPATAQAVYGLTMLIERGIFYLPPIAPALWRQIGLKLSAQSKATIASAFGAAHPPRVFLLAGVISVLGQPLGVGQGNNPTCQSARAISMWSQNDPDYLLHLVARAARTDGLVMHFEGRRLASADLPLGLMRSAPLDTDPVSMILAPHLDRIYNEMGRLCAGRGEDPHRWINPELHGWWVGRDFLIAVNVADGKLKDYDAFVNRFYCSYHPHYNGDQPVIHPQPAGIAVTDAAANFVGWHAITLLRVTKDPAGVMRVYFYNPNNDGGQNWGNGVVVSTHGNGERFGESSLPFLEFVSRLYIFHDVPSASPPALRVPLVELQAVSEMARASWAETRQPVLAAAAVTDQQALNPDAS